MIDIKRLESSELEGNQTYADRYAENFKNRKGDAKIIAGLLEANKKRKKIITKIEESKAKQNKVGQDVALLKRNKQDATAVVEEMQKLSSAIKEEELVLAAIEEEVTGILLQLPNHLHKTVPAGASETDNRIEKTVGEKTQLAFAAKNHIDLGQALRIIDFERAGKVTGARFAFLRGAGARLERALIQFMMNLHSNEHGYEEMIPPFIVNGAAMLGTGQFPKFKEDVFHLEGLDYHLIPTAEVPVTNFFQAEILQENDLPISFCAYSPCFRSEAGSYGKDTQGLIRQHQFNKVELLKFVHPDQSYEEHERLTENAEKVLSLLELPFRRMTLCAGDIGFGAAKCYDLEVWLPGQNAYREISSCSNFEDFQARRANIRFRPSGAKAKPQFVHTLNGSGLAVGRTLIAILENYQQADGSVTIPKALQPLMGISEIKAHK